MGQACSESNLVRAMSHADIPGLLEIGSVCIAGGGHCRIQSESAGNRDFRHFRPRGRIIDTLHSQILKGEVSWKRLAVQGPQSSRPERRHHVTADQIRISYYKGQGMAGIVRLGK